MRKIGRGCELGWPDHRIISLGFSSVDVDMLNQWTKLNGEGEPVTLFTSSNFGVRAGITGRSNSSLQYYLVLCI
jgi:hypothetical protein